MKYKWIVAIAILGILLVTTINVTPLPTTKAATGNWLFDVTLLASSDTNPNRRQWAQITANSFRSVGINAQVQYLLWDICYDRCITPPPEIQRKTFSQGGYDIFFVGQTPGNPAAPFLGTYQYYFSTMTAPGSNMYWYNSSTFDTAISTAIAKGYTPEGIAAYKEAQTCLFNDLPGPTIFYQTAVFAASKSVDFNGYDWVFDNLGPYPQFVSGVTNFVLASPRASFDDLIPPISNSWYDTLVYYPIFDGLFAYDTDITLKPMACTSYTVSPDGSVYSYNIRHGMTWHDGVPVTADDVVFTWYGYMDPRNLNQFTAIFTGFIGEDVTFTYTNGTSNRLVVNYTGPTGLEAWYPATPDQVSGTGRIGSVVALDDYTVQVTIADFADTGVPAGIFHPDGEPAYIIPMHILDKIPLTEWKTCPLNTGVGSITIGSNTYTGPVGSGPYSWVSWVPATGLVTEQKYMGYWNKTALEGIGQYTINNYYVKHTTNKDGAIADLKNNVVQALDQNFQLQNDAKAGNLDFADVYLQPGAGLQQIAINLNHPVFGTGVDTPNGKTDPAHAALYASYVRQALDYLIPKQLIIDTLLAGFGIPSSIAVNPIGPFFNTNCTSRLYDPIMAKSLLAAAGYATGVSPPGATVATAQYLVGQPIVFSGVFNVDPVISTSQGGFVNRLYVSYTSNTTGFTPVAEDYGTTGGYYEISYAPTQNGTMYYFVEMTGVGNKRAAEALANGPTFQYQNIPHQTAGQNTTVSSLTVTTQDAIQAPLKAQMQSQIDSLNAAVASANNFAYAGIGIGIVAILVAIWALMRKK